MKKRTFYATFLLFLTAIYTSILSLSVITLKGTMQQARQQCLNEQYFIASALYRDMAALEDRGLASQEELDSLMQPYLYLAGNRRSALFVYRDNTLLYTTGDSGNMETAPPGNQGEDRTVAIGQKGQKTLCSTWGALPRPYDSFQILYQIDITEHLDAWEERNNTMLFVGAALSFVMALSLLFLLERLFLPLSQITGLSQKIADGDYRDRLPVHDGDEIGQMAHSFNHMAEEIESKVTELAAAAENKQRFVDNFAHELRTPLTAIYGYAQYMQKAALSQEDAQFALDTILSESRRMQLMANQLMELSGLRNGEIQMVAQNLPGILDAVQRTVAHKLSENQIQLITFSQVETVMGDAVLLQSLLVNLIDNAAKASRPGTTITLKTFYEDGKIVIAVSDQGKGMDLKELERITEPYYRVDKSRNRKEGGAGLGLAICSQIARCHNASLTFQSEPGHGTTAMVIFTTP